MHELTLMDMLFIGGCLTGLALFAILITLACLVEAIRWLAKHAMAGEDIWVEERWPRSSMNGPLPLYVLDGIEDVGFWPKWGWRPWTIPALIRAINLLRGCIKRGEITPSELCRFADLLGPVGANTWSAEDVTWFRQEFAA